jgi:hypothetical protein
MYFWEQPTTLYEIIQMANTYGKAPLYCQDVEKTTATQLVGIPGSSLVPRLSLAALRSDPPRSAFL